MVHLEGKMVHLARKMVHLELKNGISQDCHRKISAFAVGVRNYIIGDTKKKLLSSVFIFGG
jgi:hypothetical protein